MKKPPETSFKAAAARVSRVLDRPLAVVRAHLLDVDHQMRDRIFHGVELCYESIPHKPGAGAPASERRVVQVMKVMGKPQTDVFVVEEGAPGEVVKRYVDGPHQGTRFVAALAAEKAATEGAPEKTKVTLEAFPGPAGFYGDFGKLSQIGLEKVLDKMLEEHERALTGYLPGKARGAVRGAIEAMRDRVVLSTGRAEGDARAVMTNLLEAASVVAIADGTADAPERDVIQEVASRLCFVELDAAAVDKMVGAVAAAVKRDGLAARCDKVAARLTALGLAEVGLEVAVLVADVSHGIDAPELAALGRLAKALGFDDAHLAAVIRRVDASLRRPIAGALKGST